MWAAILTITIIALIAGLALSFASRRLPSDSSDLIETVKDLLPQTQCAQCGYPGCRPYAAAIVEEGAAINLCPPSGNDTERHLAELLGLDLVGHARQGNTDRCVAVIDESLCIGCTYCRRACPVDAIVGAHQLMHTIIMGECTGCELCVAPCPVDCISLRALP